MDEESGILTRSEAKEVQSVVDAAGEGDGDDDDEDPFGDPVDGEETSSSVGDLAAATGELGLEEKEEEEEEVPSLNEATPVLKPAPIFIKPKTANPPPPGQLLKREFMEQRIVNTMLEFFFEFPWNNFLHNVVFDILQQIFHGRIERPLDRQLALSVFLDARLIDRILAGQAANDDRDKARTSRLGYMGHMTLIAEEVVKLFEHYPREIYAVVEPYIPQPGWDRYVATTLRETRDRDHSPLGGGIIHMPDHTSSSMSGLSDEDDEFPMHTARIIRAMEGGGQAGGGAPAIEGPFGAAPRRNSTGSEDAGTSDQFSRYLATAISSDRADKFGSSDEDEDEEDAPGWLGGSRFDPGDVDFALNETNRPSAKFSFDDDFGNGAPTFNRDSTDSDDDGDWGPFSTEPGPSSSSPFGNDDFRPTMASTSGGFESSFGDSGFDNFASGPTDGGGGDDFGDFESGDSPSIVIPSMDALEDFDFEEDGRGPAPAASTVSPSAPFGFRPSRPVFARTATAEDGSALFGGLSTSLEDTPTSPRSPSSSFSPPPLSPTTSAKALSPPTSPSLVADLATSLAEPLGPSMHEGSHFTPDGFIEAEVEGKTVKVPADEMLVRAAIAGFVWAATIVQAQTCADGTTAFFDTLASQNYCCDAAPVDNAAYGAICNVTNVRYTSLGSTDRYVYFTCSYITNTTEPQLFYWPASVSELDITLIGGRGGGACSRVHWNGYGAVVQATVTTTNYNFQTEETGLKYGYVADSLPSDGVTAPTPTDSEMIPELSWLEAEVLA
ncbi:hypothetical protein MNV49_001041 [Pseudohyphozyma bogoriensis]|nr:hypothetical protein MNV49_001041 [Pseudohyphozyma bogoriensis]